MLEPISTTLNVIQGNDYSVAMAVKLWKTHLDTYRAMDDGRERLEAAKTAILRQSWKFGSLQTLFTQVSYVQT